jgi:hypothetical protein
MAMGWTRASLIAQDLANTLVWMFERDVEQATAAFVARQRAERPRFDAAWKRREAIEPDYYGSHARLVSAGQYTDDMVSAMVGPDVAAAALCCFSRLIGPPLHACADPAMATRGTAARHPMIVRGASAQRSMPRHQARGSIRPLSAGQQPLEGERVEFAGRVSPGGTRSWARTHKLPRRALRA